MISYQKALPLGAWMHVCDKELAWHLFNLYAALNLSCLRTVLHVSTWCSMFDSVGKHVSHESTHM